MVEHGPQIHEASLDEGQSAPKRGIGGKIKATAFIAFIIAIECAAAYFYVPNSQQTAAIAGATLGIDPETGKTPSESPDDTAQEKADQVEVPLGEYSVTTFQPVSNTTLRIDFQLYGTIAIKDEDEFFRRMEENRHRFREQVIVTIRTSDITDFTEAQLGLIRRRVLEKANRVLGMPLLRGVIFSEFSFIEQ